MEKNVTLEPMFESMDIEQEQKIALQEAFDVAVLKKTTDLMEEYVEKEVSAKVETLEEEYQEKVTDLTESLDGYLDTVVEDFIAENTPMYEAQIADEKVQTLLGLFSEVALVTGVDMAQIAEAKEEKEDEEDVEGKLKAKDDKISEMAEKLVDAKREADKYLRSGLIAEMAQGLTVLETAKFEKLAEMVAFDRSADYMNKLETIKESIVDSRAEDFETNESAELPKNAFRHEEKVDTKSAMDFSKYV